MDIKILIVEDEKDLASLLSDYFVREGWDTHLIHDGSEVQPWLTTNPVQLIILDLMLPNKNGTDICREIRQTNQVPIIMTTAKVEEIDRLLGLELGADDYICKPYSPREVVARVKAILRRTQSKPDTNLKQLVVINQDKLTVNFEGKSIALTAVEFSLLKLLYDEPGRIFSRQHIMDSIYADYRIVSDRTIDSHIKKLRKKLQELAPEENLIVSVYGAGYKYEHP